jgi:hypothetical protein
LKSWKDPDSIYNEELDGYTLMVENIAMDKLGRFQPGTILPAFEPFLEGLDSEIKALTKPIEWDDRSIWLVDKAGDLIAKALNTHQIAKNAGIKFFFGKIEGNEDYGLIATMKDSPFYKLRENEARTFKKGDHVKISPALFKKSTSTKKEAEWIESLKKYKDIEGVVQRVFPDHLTVHFQYPSNVIGFGFSDLVPTESTIKNQSNDAKGKKASKELENVKNILYRLQTSTPANQQSLEDELKNYINPEDYDVESIQDLLYGDIGAAGRSKLAKQLGITRGVFDDIAMADSGNQAAQKHENKAKATNYNSLIELINDYWENETAAFEGGKIPAKYNVVLTTLNETKEILERGLPFDETVAEVSKITNFRNLGSILDDIWQFNKHQKENANENEIKTLNVRSRALKKFGDALTLIPINKSEKKKLTKEQAEAAVSKFVNDSDDNQARVTVIPTRKYYIVMTDPFMSGWGKAEKKTNKLVIGTDDYQLAELIEKNARKRKDFKYINVRTTKPYYDENRVFVSYHEPSAETTKEILAGDKHSIY